MNSTATLPTTRARPSRRFERRFYLGISIVFMALVGWTFARTYYLRPFFDARPLPTLLQVHGAVMTGWVVLLVVQSTFIAARRIQWHRQLGVFGTVWAAMVVILGSVTTVHAAAREVRAHSEFAASQVVITTLDLIQMLFFAGLVSAAVWLRRRPDYHKRLMLLTIVCMLPDALARLPVGFMTNQVIMSGLDGFVLLCVGVDTFAHRRLHPVFGWGALLILGTFHAALYFTSTPTWIAFGSRLVS
ncbi:MAG TPA: hypothetical protein VGJ29_09030 [Vicinamibacterales bacterium]|jgi:hypothetical protein